MFPSATSIQPEGSMNSRNSSDPGSSSASRPRPVVPPLSSHGFQLHAVPTSSRSHKRPDRVASKEAPLPMLTKTDEQTEDGHAKMTFDTFHSFRT